ncbi:hypothetical protein [Kribbella pratensis]|uniref:Uncharacterized protein n=1 Tax=Kribbella pratensis TaxID=2512112 RepID=A0A4R8CFK2_9ACTN|nr:hypothetical protein [Kribbella pratensis]TDW75058.1 hypothetical protein EV653_0172 [Kribbella pratensis]
MTRVDHRKPPARVARKQQKTAAGRSTPEAGPRKAQRSHSAIGAGVVAAAAMVAVFGFILTRGTSDDPPADGLRMGSGTDTGAAAPQVPTEAASGTASKADRQPPASTTAPKAKAEKTTPQVDTGPISPKFKRGQWIVVIDKYPTDVGMPADQTAKNTAATLTRAGIPAKAMLVNGQYPGLKNSSSMTPVINTWIVYLGPGSSSAQVLNLCLDPRTQAAYPSPACPTYEPAAPAGG